MSLTQIKHSVRKLSLSQLGKLDEWLHELLKRVEEAAHAERTSRKQTIAERTRDNKTYRLEGIRCGKENCKCTRGKLHGPYWYSYFSVNGRTKSECQRRQKTNLRELKGGKSVGCIKEGTRPDEASANHCVLAP